MELKQGCSLYYSDIQNRINRTFMELKLFHGEVVETTREVLIEPLWN